MRSSTDILKDIASFYTTYSYTKKVVEQHKQALKTHYDCYLKEHDPDETRLTLKGLILNYKAKSRYKWKKEGLNDELEDVGLLHLAKKIDNHVCETFQVLDTSNPLHMKTLPLSDFKLPAERYVRPYPKRRTLAQTTQEKEKLTFLLDELNQQDIESVIHSYKISHLDYKEMDMRYHSLKEELLIALQEEGMSSSDCEIGSFKIQPKTSDYDTSALVGKQFLKQLMYEVRAKDGHIHITDVFSKESIRTKEDTFVLDNHTFTFTDSGLKVDEVLISKDSKSYILSLESQFASSDEFQLFYQGVTTVTSDTFFRQLPFSTTKIESLINQGFLHPLTLERYRYVESVNHIKTNFEVITAENDIKRSEVFSRKNMNRAQRLRWMQENAKSVLREQNKIDKKIESI